MGKKGIVASIFSKPKLAAAAGSPAPPWPWPSCANNPQTASFRQGEDRHRTTAGGNAAAARGGAMMCKAAGEMYKTVNSIYFDSADDSCGFFEDDADGDAAAALDLDDGSFSTTTASEEWSEAVIRSLGRTSTDRFFFDSGPPPASNSILAASPSPSPGRRTPLPPEPKAPAVAAEAVMSVSETDPDEDVKEEEEEEEEPSTTTSLVEESVAVALDSEDPYRDFRASMAEMVAAHGLRDWAALQEMLLWYLRINGKHNHALIVGAFVDLLVGLATNGAAAEATTTTTTWTMTTTTASSSSYSSSSSSSTSGGDVATASASATAAAMVEEQCGGGGTDASSDGEGEEEPSGEHCASSSELDSCH
ncbi:hypothetical protein ACP70R_021932 [Stipagrostis hirtigluma subsp. patula]